MPQALGLQGLLPNPAAEIDALGPKGWWRLNETSGTTATAKVGTNGTYTNGPTLGAGTLAIDGNSVTMKVGTAPTDRGFVTIPNQASDVNASNTAFTIMAFCLTTDTTTGVNQLIFEIGDTTAGASLFVTGNDDFDCMCWSSSTIRSRILLANYVVTNKIYHIAYGYDSAGPTTVLYVNGDSVGTVQTNSGTAIGASTGNNGIGGVNGATRNSAGTFTTTGGPVWRGRIGDVAHFDYLLTQSQVRRVARQMMTT